MKMIWIIGLLLTGLFLPAVRASSCGEKPPLVTSVHECLRYFEEYEYIELECKASGSTTIDYTWYKDGHQVYNGAVYIISSAGQKHDGRYHCQAKNQAGIAVSPVTNLTLAFMHRAPLQEPRRFTAAVGEPLKISCSFGLSQPTATISWVTKKSATDPDSELLPQSQRIYYDQKGNLYFTNVEASDGSHGFYQCQAHNYFTDTTTGGTLSYMQVIEGTNDPASPLIMESSPLTVVGVVGRVVNLTCVFSGNPTPAVSWRRPGSTLPNNGHRLINFNKTLQLLNFNAAMEGKYQCSARNSQGSFSLEITMDSESAPTWVARPSNVVVEANRDIIITCQTRGIPRSIIQWYKNGTQIGDLPQENKMHILTDGSLRISNVHTSDTGTYQCSPCNRHGCLHGEAYLQVTCSSPPTNPPPPVLTCPRGFIKNETLGSCYKFVLSRIQMNWFQAGQFCEMFSIDMWSQNVHLLAIESREEDEFIDSQLGNLVKFSNHSMWTSGNRIDDNTDWTWARTLQPFNHRNWDAGHPLVGHDCVVLNTRNQNRWSSKDCLDTTRGVICESTLIRMK